MKLFAKQYTPDIFDATGLTLADDNATAVSELVFEESFAMNERNKYSSFIKFNTGIKNKKIIPILGGFTGLAGHELTGENCTPTESDMQLSSSQKKWECIYIGDRLVDCYTNIKETFWTYFRPSGVDGQDPSQNPAYSSYVQMRLQEYLADLLMFRILFMSDTDVAAATNNSLTSDQLKYFNTHDAIIKQCKDIFAADAARQTTLAENAQTTYATQSFDNTAIVVGTVATYRATNILNNLIKNSHIDLKRIPKSRRVILISQTIADRYAEERKAITNVDLGYIRTETGMDMFVFDGVDVVILPTYDTLILSYYDNGTRQWEPHFAIHTTKDNIQVGTLQTTDFETFSSHYDKTTKKWYLDFAFDFDVKVIVDRLIQIAI